LPCRLLITLQQYITVTLYTQRQLSSGVEAATHLLGMLASANDIAGNLDHFEFYNDALNNEDFNVKEDFRRWKVVRGQRWYRVSYCKVQRNGRQGLGCYSLCHPHCCWYTALIMHQQPQSAQQTLRPSHSSKAQMVQSCSLCNSRS
jgi:hypothetical protein